MGIDGNERSGGRAIAQGTAAERAWNDSREPAGAHGGDTAVGERPDGGRAGAYPACSYASCRGRTAGELSAAEPTDYVWPAAGGGRAAGAGYLARDSSVAYVKRCCHVERR